MQTAYITHPACLKHELGAAHPESPARLMAIDDRLIAAGLHDLLQHHEAPRASRTQLARVHTLAYLDAIEAAAPAAGVVEVGPDTWMNPFTLEAAQRAAGAVILATDLVMTRQVENAFCNIRPPGHHASCDRALGLCIYNNVAVGAMHALANHGLQRIAIADFDVHHGNGTEEIFRDDPRVLLCSVFQYPLFPNSGADSGNDHIVNVALSEGADSTAFRAALQQDWLPALDAFQPEMIFISAGFDAHWEDDIADLSLVETDYVWITQQLLSVAQRWAQNRMVSVLEGGYALRALGRCAAGHIKVLSGL